MRVAWASSVAIVAGATLVAVGSVGAGTTQRATAGEARAFTVGRLPAPITLTTGRGSEQVARDGRITRIATPALPAPKDGSWFPGTGAWYAIRDGHLVVGRVGRGHALWRSRGLFPSRWRLGVVAAGSQGVAFSYHKWLYVAPRAGPERPVARAEGAVGWTTGGVYTYGGQGNKIRLRSATGEIKSTVAPRPDQHAYEPTTGSLFLVVDGELIWAHGARTHRLASFTALGLPPKATWMQPLAGGRIELMSADRLTVLNADGSTFASTLLPRTWTISSGLAVAPDRSAIAFTASAGRTPSHSAHGTETVYLLRPNARRAVPIHTERVTFAPCERGADVQWRGRWLLYSNSEGNVAAINTHGNAIELTIPSRASASWSKN